MLSLLRRSEGADVTTDTAPAAAGADAATLHAAVSSIAERASSMGREAAEVRGVIDDTTKAAQRSAQAVSALAQRVQEITSAQNAIKSIKKNGPDAPIEDNS